MLNYNAYLVKLQCGRTEELSSKTKLTTLDGTPPASFMKQNKTGRRPVLKKREAL